MRASPLLLCALMLPVAAAEPALETTVPFRPAPPAEAPPASGGLWSSVVQFGDDTWHDTGSVIATPLDWGAKGWGGFGLAIGAIVGLGAAFDDQVHVDIQEDRSRFSNQLAKEFNPLGTAFSLVTVVGAYVVGVAIDDQGLRDLARDGLEASIIASGVISPILKYAIGRQRPDQGNGEPDVFKPFSGNSSFPSGHATQAFTLAGVLAASYPDNYWLMGSGFAIAGLVGYSRLNDNKHFLSDVVAGAVLGTAVGWEVVELNHGRRGIAIDLRLDRDVKSVALSWRF